MTDPAARPAHTRPRRRSAVIAGLAVVYVLGSGLMWALITPRGGGHDEPAHISYAASVTGGSLGRLAPVVVRPHAGAVAPGPFIFDEPTSVPWTYRVVVAIPEWAATDNVDVCFARRASVTADCDPRHFPATVRQYWTFSQVDHSESGRLVETPTTVTAYPPPYHWLVGLPSLASSGNAAFYAMRFVSVSLAAGLVGSGLAVASPRRRSWLAVGVMLAFTPTAAFLTGVINPSGFEIAAALGLFIGLVGVEASHAGRRLGVVIPLLLLAFAVAWARPLSFFTLAAVLGAAGLLNGKELISWLGDRVVRLVMGIGVGLALMSAALFQILVRAPLERLVAIGAGLWDVPGDAGVLENIGSAFGKLLTWGVDSVGFFGWRDHWSPTSVRLGWLVVLTSIWLLGLLIASGWRRFALFTVGVGAVVVTPATAIVFFFGAVEPYTIRYHLPVLVLLPVAAVFVLDRRHEGRAVRGISRRTPAPEAVVAGPLAINPTRLRQIVRWAILLAPVVMVVSAAASLYRYGLGGMPSVIDLVDLFFGPDKQWIPPPAAIVASILAIAMLTAASAALVWHLRHVDGHDEIPAEDRATAREPRSLRETVGL